MKKVAIIQNGTAADIMVTASLVSKMVKENTDIHCLTNQENGCVLKSIRGVQVEFIPDVKIHKWYDMAVNLNPDPVGGSLMNQINAAQKMGYGFDGDRIVFFDKHSDLHYRTTKLGIYTEKNLFQLTFGMVGLKWAGDGYGIHYYPKNRQKNLTGICIRDGNLREYILDKLKPRGQKLFRVPIKLNILKQFDEVNRCKRIVTDDSGCMHIALSLRKHVEFISRRIPSHRIELFGNGNYHVFNMEVLSGNQPE